MKKITLLLAALFAANAGFTQLTVNNLGKTYIGTINMVHDQYNVLAASVFGTNGVCRAGSKLAFGDFGRFSHGGANVFIGEYTDADTDKLWLHGKGGIYLTRDGWTPEVVAYFLETGTDAFYFNTNVYSKGLLLNSDVRFKSNIRQIETPLSKLLALEGVSYDFSNKIRKDELLQQYNEANTAENKSISDDVAELSEKEKAALKEREALLSRPEQKEHKLGFIAQDLQKIFPDLVKEDDMGYLAVDYIGLIPVVVEALKEQQAQIEKLKLEIQSGKSMVRQESASLVEAVETATECTLFQNVPNPFSLNTEIKFYIPAGVQDAKLCIYNMQGNQLKQIPLMQRGSGSQTISASEFPAGMYLYTLIADGQEVDTKRMILTE